MKKMLLVALVSVFALALPAWSSRGRAEAQNRLVCNNETIIACRQIGGTFNFSQCRCEVLQ